MSIVFDKLVNYLEKESWPLDRSNAPENWVASRFKGDNAGWAVTAAVSKPVFLYAPGFELVVFRSILDQNVPPGRRASVQELVCRSNYNTLFGHLDFDLSDGELSFWTGGFCNEKDDLDPVFHDLVMTNVLTMDLIYPAIMRVIYGEVSPESALEALDPSLPAAADGQSSGAEPSTGDPSTGGPPV